MTMAEERFRLPAKEFKGPPLYPHLYPGERPASSYVLSHDDGVPTVFQLFDVNLGRLEAALVAGTDKTLDEFLVSKGRAPVEERLVSLAYGSNVNPMQLVNRKFGALQTKTGLPDIDVVAIKGFTENYAVVFLPYIPEYGSVPATIMPSPGKVETWILLLDDEQLKRMNDTEGLNIGSYRMGVQPFTHEGLTLPAYGYLGGKSGVFLDPTTSTPVRFAGRNYTSITDDFVPIDSTGSDLPESTELEMMILVNTLQKKFSGMELFEWAKKAFVLTQSGKERSAWVNSFLRDFHSRPVEFPGTEFVDNPYETESLKRLKDVA